MEVPVGLLEKGDSFTDESCQGENRFVIMKISREEIQAAVEFKQGEDGWFRTNHVRTLKPEDLVTTEKTRVRLI